MKSNIIDNFNLPKYIKGKSFSEASEAINKKFNERKDPAAKQTKQELLERLAKAQEYVKMQEQAAQQSQQGDVPEGMEDFVEQSEDSNQMFLGGDTSSAGVDPTATSSTPMPGMGDVNTALNFGSQIFGDAETNSTEKVNEVGATVGGVSTGVQAGSKFGPIGGAVGGALGGTAGAIGAGKRNKEAVKNLKNQDLREGMQNRNLFKKGGYTNKYEDGGSINTGGIVDPNVLQDALNRNNQISNINQMTGSSDDWHNSPSFKPLNPPKKQDTGDEYIRGGIGTPKKQENVDQSKKSWLGRNATEIARTAPLINNLITSKNLEKADPIRRDRLGMRYQPQQIDEESVFNKINQNNVNKALSESSGGDLGALRTNILAANLNKDKAISDTSVKAQQQNLSDNVRGQQFNRGVDSVNMQQSNQDKVDARMDDANYESIKQNLKNATAENIANLAKEIGDKETVKKMFGYRFDGTYFYDDQGNTVSKEDVAKNVKNK